MFEAGLIREAIDWNAPFLQCRKYFHTVSMAMLQGIPRLLYLSIAHTSKVWPLLMSYNFFYLRQPHLQKS